MHTYQYFIDFSQVLLKASLSQEDHLHPDAAECLYLQLNLLSQCDMGQEVISG